MLINKPLAILEKRCIGFLELKPVYTWIAINRRSDEIARAKTKKECELLARQAGYRVEH